MAGSERPAVAPGFAGAGVVMLLGALGLAGYQAIDPAAPRPEPGGEAVRLTAADLFEDPDGMQGEMVAVKAVTIGPGVSIVARLEVTAKGNGALHVPGLVVGAYDSHDDGSLFQPYLLDVVFVDVSGDRYADLIVSGVAVDTEATDPDHAGEVVLGVFRFDPGSGRFVRAFTRGPSIVIDEQSR